MRQDVNGAMPRIVSMAMDLTPYLKELKGKRILCDEYTYEAASMYRFVYSNRDKVGARDFVVFHDENRVSWIRGYRFVDSSVEGPYRGELIETGSVCITALPASDCDVFIATMTAKGIDVHVAALFDDGGYVWHHVKAEG